MGTFDSGGLSIAYDDIASEASKTVFLVHGFATNRSENWRRLGWYGAFERKGYRIVALDLRGHGESAKPPTIKPLMAPAPCSATSWA